MDKAKKFRELLNRDEHFVLMEAHDGLSASIVEEAGFPAIWASGLSITAALGVRDNNEISYTQLLDVLEYMNDACSLPILVDGDTGYGNFNNATRLLQKLEQLGIAAICIEDKKFPKTNSFLETSVDALADPLEFAGKIRAMKEAQKTPDFTVIARLESIIVGAGVDDAIMRGKMYLDAGADALLVHSKLPTSKDIDDFLTAFDRDTPIFLVPTKYYAVPVSRLTRDKRVRGIIWANHNIRACVTAMQQVSKQIYNDNSIARVESTIAPVSEVFRLQKNEEYLEMEKKYLPSYPQYSATILAAGSPGSLSYYKPKSLLSIGGKSILDRQLDALTAMGISKISIVRGFMKDEINVPDVTMIDNDRWQTSKVMYSLFLASKKKKQPYFALYGDVIFKRYLLRMMLDSVTENPDADLVLVCVDDDYIGNNFTLVLNKNSDTALYDDGCLEVIRVSTKNAEKKVGNYVFFSGLMLIKNYTEVKRILDSDDIESVTCEDFLKKALENKLKIIAIVSSKDSIVDINTVNDLIEAGEVYA